MRTNYIVKAGTDLDEKPIATFTNHDDAVEYREQYNGIVRRENDEAWIDEITHYDGDQFDVRKLFNTAELKMKINDLVEQIEQVDQNEVDYIEECSVRINWLREAL